MKPLLDASGQGFRRGRADDLFVQHGERGEAAGTGAADDAQGHTPVLGGLAIIPSIIGAALVVLLLGAVSGALARNNRV